MAEAGGSGPRGTGGRGASWVEKYLGPGWVEVQPGIYEYLLNEVRTKTGLRLAAPPDEDEAPKGDPSAT